ncbi:MAG: ABC transporter ATP-binding protein [Deltaproteobacteria bacterium]|jgi:iron complex transport system ATP-binding protein|nr:ABC transporter ATP-binding protein [Deltaproteobacteria bacterium]
MDLSLEKVSCGYGSKTIVQGFSATIAVGQVFCLLGPNGIGKTTLFKAILGFLPLKEGRATIDGRDFSSFSRRERARLLGYVPQSQFTPFAFSVLDVVLMGRTAYMGFLGRPRKKDYQVAEEVLERLGVSYLRDRLFTELSGGEKQMVLIARALAQEPVFLMMDEPTSNLDFGNQARVLQNIRTLATQGLGIILTTHNPDHVFQCGSDVALFRPDGGFVVGPRQTVLTSRNLSETYNLPISVLSWPDSQESFQVCRPCLS